MRPARPVRIARTSMQANEWALVLDAAGIPHAVASDDGGFTLLVAEDDVDRAEAALAAYDRETRDATAAVPPPVSAVAPYPWMSGVTVGLFLLGFFAVTGPSASRSHWFERGAAVAGRVLGDEPWRAVTALTLHTDVVHVLHNAVATAVLLPPLVQRVGVGGALCLTLLSGVVGNLVSAIVHDSRHAAIGFSTAAFGIIGLLAALRLVGSTTPGATSRRGWLVVAATVLLLVMLGTARDADVVAHALGLCAGGGFGLAAGVLVRRPPSAPVQWALTTLTALAVGGAWRLALHAR